LALSLLSLALLARVAGRPRFLPNMWIDLTRTHASSPQDLKDFGRLGSNTITFADVDRNNPGTG